MPHASKTTRPMLIGLVAVGAVLLLTAAAATWAHLRPETVSAMVTRVFGPPAAAGEETHPPRPAGPKVDHGAFDRLLRAHVDAEGGVDYAALMGDASCLDGYLDMLAAAPFDRLGRHEKLALLINAYNAFTLRLILDHWDEGRLNSIKQIPARRRWSDRRWRVGEHTWSLNDVEHEQIRANFQEPRIHFALVCAAWSCPRLRNEAYRADRLAEQLDDQTRQAHAHPRWYQFDAQRGVVRLTRLYDWYGADFLKVADSVLDYAARYDPALQAAVDAGRPPRVEWIHYDWKLNLSQSTGSAGENR